MKRICLSTVVLGLLLAQGCAGPLSRDSTRSLRRQIVHANREQVAAVRDAENTQLPAQRPTGLSYIQKRENPDQQIQALDEMSGPEQYMRVPLEVGEGLDGEPTDTVAISLEEAIRSAVRNNLEVEIARLQPAISEAQIVAAEAAFDATFFTDFSYAKNDAPQPAPLVNGTPVGTAVSSNDVAELTTGIRQPLITGGQATLSTGLQKYDNNTPGLTRVPDPAWSSNLLLGLSQPLLRNFGTLVNRSQIYLARNAHRRDVLSFQAQLLSTLGEVEQAYWRLVLAGDQLAIRERLLDRTIAARDRVERRSIIDANPVQVAQAYSFVALREADVVRARQSLRNASDDLKRLINDPQLPLAGETLLAPVDRPVEVPVAYDLLDAVTTALQTRPEMRQALLSIDNSSIRMAVADNQRLPLLNLNAQMQYQGLEDGPGDSYGDLTDGDFINYLIGAQFEAPIGNRRAEAQFRRTRIARQANVVQYKRTAQQVVQAVKSAMREVRTSYELIGVARTARRAAADNLRALRRREEQGEALTPEFLLDLKLQTQQRLANAEIQELQAMINYNTAIARLNQVTGTLLEHNQIEFVWPDTMFDEPADETFDEKPPAPMLNALK